MTSALVTEDHICVGVITGSRGTKGEVTVKSFTGKPENLAAYGPVMDDLGHVFNIKVVSQKKGILVVRLSGIKDRNTSDILKGKRLFILKSMLPKKEKNEFFFFDLLGLSAETATGEKLGIIKNILNFGAGDILELSNGTMVSFTMETVPEIDLKRKIVVVKPPLEF